MFDYEKLKLFLKHHFSSQEIKIFYYTAYPAEGTRDFSIDGKHKFFTYLKKDWVLLFGRRIFGVEN